MYGLCRKPKKFSGSHGGSAILKSQNLAATAAVPF
jgi:hypothetical protein